MSRQYNLVENTKSGEAGAEPAAVLIMALGAADASSVMAGDYRRFAKMRTAAEPGIPKQLGGKVGFG